MSLANKPRNRVSLANKTLKNISWKENIYMSDYLDYMDEIYEELVDEFGHEIESTCIHE